MPVPRDVRATQAASELHRKHRAWWDQVVKLAEADRFYDDMEKAELKLRLKFAYEDYCRYRWEEDLLLSVDWLDSVSPEDFLDWYQWSGALMHGQWEKKAREYLASPEFQNKVHVALEKLQNAAQTEFEYTLGLNS